MNIQKLHSVILLQIFQGVMSFLVHCLYTGSLLPLYIVFCHFMEFLHSRKQHSDSYYSSLLWVDAYMLQFNVLQLIWGFYLAYNKKKKCWRKWFPLACRYWTHV